MEKFIKDISSLTKQKEDEITWSKTDTLLTNISESLRSTEDVQKIFPILKDLLIKSMMSDRSKLSGTALALLNKIIDITSGCIPNINEILHVLFKISGRSNRVVSKRGQDGVINLCKHIDLVPYLKIIFEYVASTNKTIRLSVYQSLEASFSNREIPRSYEKILQKGREDPFLEARVVARRIGAKSTIEEKKPPKAFIPPVCHQMTMPSVSHSPLRKVFKIENKVEKINAIKEKVKTIVNPKPIKAKTQKVIEPYKTRDLLQAIPKKDKVVHDDLTPKKLDRFLSKYRNVYGNLLEDDINDDAKSDIKSQIVDIGGEDVVGNQPQDLKNNCQINGHYESVQDNDLENEPVDKQPKEHHGKQFDILSEYSYANKDTSQAILEGLVESYETVHVSIDTIEKEVGNLSIIEEESDQGHFDFTIVNSEPSETPTSINEKESGKNEDKKAVKETDKETKVEQTQDINNVHQDVNTDIQNINDSINGTTKVVNEFINDSVNGSTRTIDDSKTTSPSKCPQFIDISSNRFSPLLFADKDECIIYDINEGDRRFKTPTSVSTKDKTFTSPLDVPVVKNALSSSFLYSKDEETSPSDDFTQIDSLIYVNKKTFTRTDK